MVSNGIGRPLCPDESYRTQDLARAILRAARSQPYRSDALWIQRAVSANAQTDKSRVLMRASVPSLAKACQTFGDASLITRVEFRRIGSSPVGAGVGYREL